MALTPEKREWARLKALEYYDKAHIYLTEEERANIEIADMGMGMRGAIPSVRFLRRSLVQRPALFHPISFREHMR